MRHGSKPKKKMMTAGTAVFACYSAACAPPSAGGTGGSIAGKGPKGGGSGGSGSGNSKTRNFRDGEMNFPGGWGKLLAETGAIDKNVGDKSSAVLVRNSFNRKAASSKSPRTQKYYKAAFEGANAMLDSSVTKEYAKQKIKEARSRANQHKDSDPERSLYNSGWAEGAEKAARARWG